MRAPLRAFTKEEYEAMEKKAHELGLGFLTKYRKGLKNIRVGELRSQPSQPNNKLEEDTK